eukprot:symbB.v1.2.001491.t1/scaffold82.1/size400680/1
MSSQSRQRLLKARLLHTMQAKMKQVQLKAAKEQMALLLLYASSGHLDPSCLYRQNQIHRCLSARSTRFLSVLRLAYLPQLPLRLSPRRLHQRWRLCPTE